MLAALTDSLTDASASGDATDSGAGASQGVESSVGVEEDGEEYVTVEPLYAMVRIVLYCTVLYCTVLHCTARCCAVS